MTNGAQPRVVAGLWTACLVSLPFHRVWTLPWLGTKLQPPELMFLALAAAAAVLWWRGEVHWRFSPIDAGVTAWILANLLAIGVTWRGPYISHSVAVTEVAGSLYLAALYVVVRMTATRELLNRFASMFTWSAAIAATVGVVGVGLSWLGLTTRLATLAQTPVPYLGFASRALGLTAHPGMLASILVLAVLLHSGRVEGRWRRRDVGVLLLLLVGLLLTVSKTMVCLVAGLAVMVGMARGRRASRRMRWAATVVWVMVALVFTIGAHVMLVRESAVGRLRSAQIVAGDPLTRVRGVAAEPWVLMPTTYLFNKHASLLAVYRTWPWGVGPGGHNVFVATLQQERTYPPMIFPDFTDPHSTYFGSAAELGTAGLMALLILLSTVSVTVVRLVRDGSMPGWTAASYGWSRRRVLDRGDRNRSDELPPLLVADRHRGELERCDHSRRPNRGPDRHGGPGTGQ